MEEEIGKILFEYLKKLSPGTPLRSVINDLIHSHLGALIVIDNPEVQKIIEGGFRVNCRFTPQRLFELCKMDGAIIISYDLKRILYANVLLIPDNSIYSSETGTRHKAGEKTAKQADTLVIAVSERKRKTTLYLGKLKYTLKTSSEIIRDLSTALQVLEKQREIFDDLLSKLNILEISDLVSVSDVCKVIQRAEMILKISETIKKSFTELGKEGNIINMRYKELIRNIEKSEEEIIRDYAAISLKKAKKILQNITFEGVLDLEPIARLLIEKSSEESIQAAGFRFLSHLKLNEKEISQIVSRFENLNNLLEAQQEQLEEVLKNRTEAVKKEINLLREKILSGKII